MTTLTPSDLADLTRAVEALDPAPWEVDVDLFSEEDGVVATISDASTSFLITHETEEHGVDTGMWARARETPAFRRASGIVALRNAAPALLATLAALQAENERLVSTVAYLHKREAQEQTPLLGRIAELTDERDRAVARASLRGDLLSERAVEADRLKADLAESRARATELGEQAVAFARERDAARLDAATCRAAAEEAIRLAAFAQGEVGKLDHLADYAAIIRGAGDLVSLRSRLAHPDAERLRGMVDEYEAATIEAFSVDVGPTGTPRAAEARAAILADLGVPVRAADE